MGRGKVFLWGEGEGEQGALKMALPSPQARPQSATTLKVENLEIGFTAKPSVDV